MSDFAIRVEGLGKQYKIGMKRAFSRTFSETLSSVAANIFRRSSRNQSEGEHDSIWALKNVSFEVKEGEVFGVIGKNGSGKSTLLKIISGITAPTTGEIELYGRVGSLLEVGTGFHPELSGRENVYLNGAVLGLGLGEIKRKFDEIVAFAEVEKFIDTPVKHYSSGMYVRLAFAVAAHLEPDILILDEVLAVGDLSFQRKCLGKMGNVAQEGRTVLFVSHSMGSVRKFCTRAMYLDNGEIRGYGDPSSVIMQYLDEVDDKPEVGTWPSPAQHAPGRACSLTVEDGEGKAVATIPVGQIWQVRVMFEVTAKTEHFMIALGLRTSDDLILRTSWSEPCDLDPGLYTALFREDTITLGSGRYSLVIGLSTQERTFHYIENAGFLDIADYAEGADFVRIRGVGAILNPLCVQIRKVE